jgi:hypothetical protein
LIVRDDVVVVAERTRTVSRARPLVADFGPV